MLIRAMLIKKSVYHCVMKVSQYQFLVAIENLSSLRKPNSLYFIIYDGCKEHIGETRQSKVTLGVDQQDIRQPEYYQSKAD